MKPPRFSACIPAYNRAHLLTPLLDSIFAQDFTDFEVVITEDVSREQAQIRAIAHQYQGRFPGRLTYVENETNLGFDGNIRKLVASSSGEYCVFMGNDDLMSAGGLAALDAAIERHPDVGVVLRSYAAFESNPVQPIQEFRYFPDERLFAAGVDAAAVFFRRCVVICGVCLHRESAARIVTTELDGTLLYQIYLVARILFEKSGVSVPHIVALYRNGGVPEFGNAEAEKGKFVPADRTVASSVQFMRGVLQVARAVDREHGQGFYNKVVADYANYSYPFLSIQAWRPRFDFIGYWWALSKLGFWPYPMFHIYFFSLLVLGEQRSDAIIAWIKRRLGYTPLLGSLSRGKAP